MPYNPGVVADGGKYILAGALSASKAIGDAIGDRLDESRKKQEEADNLGGVAAHYFGTDPVKMADFSHGSIGTKRAMVTTALSDHMEQLKQTQQDFNNDLATKEYYLRSGEADRATHAQDMLDWEKTDRSKREWYDSQHRDTPFTPTPEKLKELSDAGYIYAPESARGGTMVVKRPPAMQMPSMGDDPTGTGDYYFNGKVLEQRHQPSLPASTVQNITTTQMQLDGINKDIADYKNRIEKDPNAKTGWFGDRYKDLLDQASARAEKKMKEIETLQNAGRPAPRRMPPEPGITIGNPGAAPGAASSYYFGQPGAGSMDIGGMSLTPPTPAAPGGNSSGLYGLPPQPARTSIAPTPAAAPQFEPGKLFRDPQTGARVRANPDGTLSEEGAPAPKPAAPLVPAGRPAAAVDEPLLDRVKAMEGFNPKAYSDGAQMSVGYGTRARSPDERLTEPQAHARLADELATHAGRIDDAAAKAGLKLGDNQRRALISYDYSTGKGAKAVLNSGGDLHAIAQTIAHGPRTQGGTLLPGLVKRRADEALWFLQPDDQQAAASR